MTNSTHHLISYFKTVFRVTNLASSHIPLLKFLFIFILHKIFVCLPFTHNKMCRLPHVSAHFTGNFSRRCNAEKSSFCRHCVMETEIFTMRLALQEHVEVLPIFLYFSIFPLLPLCFLHSSCLQKSTRPLRLPLPRPPQPQTANHTATFLSSSTPVITFTSLSLSPSPCATRHAYSSTS